MEKSRTLFQFHKGTIKTIILQMQNNILMKFQFHKGTIKTSTDHVLSAHIINFNSIKVRLKHLKKTA